MYFEVYFILNEVKQLERVSHLDTQTELKLKTEHLFCSGNVLGGARNRRQEVCHRRPYHQHTTNTRA